MNDTRLKDKQGNTVGHIKNDLSGRSRLTDKCGNTQGYYDRDNLFYLRWDPLSQSPEAVQRYLDEWVYGVKDRAAQNRLAKHFLQTERLGTQLDIVVVPLLALASRVVDWVGHAGMELNDIGFTAEAIKAAEHWKSPFDSNTRNGLVPWGVGLLMGLRPLECVSVFDEHAFNVDQGAAAVAVNEMVQGRKRQGVVHCLFLNAERFFGVHSNTDLL